MTASAPVGGALVEPDAWVAVGRIGRPHGVRGGMHLYLDNPDSDLLRDGLPLRLELPSGKAAEVRVAKVYGPGLVLLEGVSDRDAAAAYNGAEVQARRSDFPPLEEDEAYLVDLLGARVVHKDGRELGVIEGFDDNRAQPLAAVRRTFEGAPGDVVDMPFVPGIVVDVDEEARVVIVDPPWGLLEGEPEEAGAKPAPTRGGRR